jgi:hypothetical protein
MANRRDRQSRERPSYVRVWDETGEHEICTADVDDVEGTAHQALDRGGYPVCVLEHQLIECVIDETLRRTRSSWARHARGR